MPKAPPNTPSKGDRVAQRGRPYRLGRLIKAEPEGEWVTVEWDDGGGPRVCHRFELEKIDDEAT